MYVYYICEKNRSKMDGLNCFKQLFPNDDELVDYVIRNTLFFKKDIVFQQARVYRQAIRMVRTACFAREPDATMPPR